jgi:RNA polymerase subunit RPABC4/transcription elongation factor Spt4
MSGLLGHAVFVFAVLGSKLIIALWAIYYLFPADRSCPVCNEETLAIQTRASRISGWRTCGSLLFLGKVRTRWCPACSWEGFTRPLSPPAPVLERSLVEDPADHPSSLR